MEKSSLIRRIFGAEKEKSSVKSRKFYFCRGHSTMKRKFDYEKQSSFMRRKF